VDDERNDGSGSDESFDGDGVFNNSDPFAEETFDDELYTGGTVTADDSSFVAEEDRVGPDDLSVVAGDDGERWILAAGHLTAERFISLAFDFARQEWGAAVAGEWLASFGGDELMAASIWHGWLAPVSTNDRGDLSGVVVEAGVDGACPITTIPAW
jgi:hypothetical protein